MTQTVSDPSESRQPSRPASPPTARAIRVVELLADPAVDALNLAEIVRLTGLSRATAHAIVGELTDHGWAVRHPGTGAYTIGPAFVALARTAGEADRVGHWMGTAVHRLVEGLEMPVFAARRLSADSITVVEYGLPGGADAAPAEPHPWMQAGRRIRLRPPISREFIAWGSTDARKDWIAHAPASSRTRLEMVLDAIRARGYSIERMTDDHVAMMDALGSLDTVSEQLRTRVGDLLTELTTVDYLPDELVGEVAAVTVGAPVFDGRGDQVVAAIVACPNRTLEVEALTAIGDATRAAADTVTRQLAGAGR